MNADLNSAAVRDLLASWLAAARSKLAQPDKIGARELNRLGELVLSVAALVAEQEAKAASAARLAQARASMGAIRGER